MSTTAQAERVTPGKAPLMTTAAALAAATPATRDRYVDLLRVVSLGAVVAGHWLMAATVPASDGTVRITNVLGIVPALQPATWLLQVMPLFFVVGGFCHATALASPRSGGYAAFIRRRAARLLRPTAAFVVVWLVVAVLIQAAGWNTGLLRSATKTVAQPLWFVGVYLVVTATAAPLWRLHRRLGRAAVAVPAGLAGAAVVVDLLRLGLGWTWAGYLNAGFVWLAVHQIGFFYADGTLLRLGRAFAAWLAAAGLAAVGLLTVPGPYPVSLVGVPGEPVSNMAPPTVVLLAHAAWLTGLALLLRPVALRWLARAQVWRVVVGANGVAMTAFLWHLTGMFGVLAVLLTAGRVQPAAGSAAWWLTRPAWVLACAGLTAVLVAVFRGVDRPPPPGASRPAAAEPGRDAAAALGVGLAAAGMVALSRVGLRDVTTLGLGDLTATGWGGSTAVRPFGPVPVTPMTALVLFAAGAVLLSLSRRAGPDSGGPLRQRTATGPPRQRTAAERAGGPALASRDHRA